MNIVAVLIIILGSWWMGYQAGKHADERRRRRERERIWKREQDRLPRAIRVLVSFLVASLIISCKKSVPTNSGHPKETCTCRPYQGPEQGHADTLDTHRG